MKIWYLSTTDPAWSQLRTTLEEPDQLRIRVADILRQLELQVWSELMEGLIAANACKDYLDLSKEAVARFPTDAVFPSELANAESWLKQREKILKAQHESGELSVKRMRSTLENGSVYPVAYPWMGEGMINRDDAVFKMVKEEFQSNSANATVAKSTIRNVSGGNVDEFDVLGVVASKDINVGDTVLVDSTLASVLESDKDRCPACCAPISTSTISNACCPVLYCSHACSAIALSTFHPAVCGKDFSDLFTAATDSQPTSSNSLDSMLLLRILALSKQHAETNPLETPLLARLTPTYGLDQLTIFSFVWHIVFPITLLQRLDIDPFSDPSYDTWVLHTLRCRVQNNQHAQILDGTLGTSVSPLYSMFNHSCAPNIDWDYVDGSSTVRMFAVKKVAKGEELFISYLRAWDMDIKERQAKLMGWLGRACGCAKCEGEMALEARESQ